MLDRGFFNTNIKKLRRHHRSSYIHSINGNIPDPGISNLFRDLKFNHLRLKISKGNDPLVTNALAFVHSYTVRQNTESTDTLAIRNVLTDYKIIYLLSAGQLNSESILRFRERGSKSLPDQPTESLKLLFVLKITVPADCHTK